MMPLDIVQIPNPAPLLGDIHAGPTDVYVGDARIVMSQLLGEKDRVIACAATRHEHAKVVPETLSPAETKVIQLTQRILLGDHQSAISDTFAGRLPAPGGDKFACAQWRALATGAPALEGALVALDCRLVAQLRQGSHSVFIGAVAEVALGEGAPLVYAKRVYRNLGRPLDALAPAA